MPDHLPVIEFNGIIPRNGRVIDLLAGEGEQAEGCDQKAQFKDSVHASVLVVC
jgi:hypothetical protein